jgi:hypothetical protein
MVKHIFKADKQIEDYPELVVGKWYYWDEAGLLGEGPFDTYKEAETAYQWYCAWNLR